MHARRAERYLPTPDFDLTEPDAVWLTAYDDVVDPAYSRLLMQAH